LFCNDYGKKLDRHVVRYYFEKYNHFRGVSKVSVHLFRNYFAREWLLNGGDEVRLMQLMGWSSISMVAHYARMFGVDLQRNYDEYNPLSKIKNTNREKIRMNTNNRKLRMI